MSELCGSCLHSRFEHKPTLDCAACGCSKFVDIETERCHACTHVRIAHGGEPGCIGDGGAAYCGCVQFVTADAEDDDWLPEEDGEEDDGSLPPSMQEDVFVNAWYGWAADEPCLICKGAWSEHGSDNKINDGERCGFRGRVKDPESNPFARAAKCGGCGLYGLPFGTAAGHCTCPAVWPTSAARPLDVVLGDINAHPALAGFYGHNPMIGHPGARPTSVQPKTSMTPGDLQLIEDIAHRIARETQAQAPRAYRSYEDEWRDRSQPACVVDGCGHGRMWHAYDEATLDVGACAKPGCACKAFDHPWVAAERADRAQIGALTALYAQTHQIGRRYPGINIGGFGPAPASGAAGAQVHVTPAEVPSVAEAVATANEHVGHPAVRSPNVDATVDAVDVLAAWGLDLVLGAIVLSIVRHAQGGAVDELRFALRMLAECINKLERNAAVHREE